MVDAVDARYRAEHIVSVEPKDTLEEWAYILALCQRQYPIGFGVLDSFLSGADLVRRIALVEQEAIVNEWLRLELRDTLALNQDWPVEYFEQLKLASNTA